MPIQEKRILKEFDKLVSIDSESYAERGMADYLKNKLTDLGLEVYEDKANYILKDEKILDNPLKSSGNLYGILRGTVKGEGILLSSHMDTVKPGKDKKAIYHEDGKITSDGSTILGADDVGGIVSILEALSVIKEDGLEHADIEVVFPIAEEPYAQGSRVFDYSKVRAKKAYVFDLNGKIGTAAIAAPTIISFNIKIYGKSAHAGFCPQEGIHSIEVASLALSQLKNGWIDENTSLNFGTITGGTARNIVPDYVEVTGEIRSLVHENALKLMDKVKSVFEDMAKKEGAKTEIDSRVEFKAYNISENEDVVIRYIEACKKSGVKEPKLIKTFGGSDNNHFNEHGMKGIVVASAMHKVHTTKEYTTVSDLVQSATIALGLATS